MSDYHGSRQMVAYHVSMSPAMPCTGEQILKSYEALARSWGTEKIKMYIMLIQNTVTETKYWKMEHCSKADMHQVVSCSMKVSN